MPFVRGRLPDRQGPGDGSCEWLSTSEAYGQFIASCLLLTRRSNKSTKRKEHAGNDDGKENEQEQETCSSKETERRNDFDDAAVARHRPWSVVRECGIVPDSGPVPHPTIGGSGYSATIRRGPGYKLAVVRNRLGFRIVELVADFDGSILSAGVPAQRRARRGRHPRAQARRSPANAPSDVRQATGSRAAPQRPVANSLRPRRATPPCGPAVNRKPASLQRS